MPEHERDPMSELLHERILENKALTKQRDRVFDDLISLKLDIWATHMARETLECPSEGGCREGLSTKRAANWLNSTRHCIPCWQRFAHGEK